MYSWLFLRSPQLRGLVQAFHTQWFTQSLEGTSDYVFKSKIGLCVFIFDNLQTALHYNLDRDNAPAYDANKNDHEYLLTAGLW